MIGALIQARMGSKRLPKKVLQKVIRKPLLEIMLNRLNKSKNIDKIILCTTLKKEDDKLINFCKKNKLDFFRGSSENVMSRYLKAAEKFKIKTIVRLTADCPLVDPYLIDIMINKFKKLNINYLANTNPPDKSTYPDGTDIEIFDYESFNKINKFEKRKEYLEHVTYNYWKEKKYISSLYKNNKDWSNFRYTLDYEEDLKVLKKIINNFKENIDSVNTNKIVNFLKKNNEVYHLNHQCKNLSKIWKKPK